MTYAHNVSREVASIPPNYGIPHKCVLPNPGNPRHTSRAHARITYRLTTCKLILAAFAVGMFLSMFTCP